MAVCQEAVAAASFTKSDIDGMVATVLAHQAHGRALDVDSMGKAAAVDWA